MMTRPHIRSCLTHTHNSHVCTHKLYITRKVTYTYIVLLLIYFLASCWPCAHISEHSDIIGANNLIFVCLQIVICFIVVYIRWIFTGDRERERERDMIDFRLLLYFRVSQTELLFLKDFQCTTQHCYTQLLGCIRVNREFWLRTSSFSLKEESDGIWRGFGTFCFLTEDVVKSHLTN